MVIRFAQLGTDPVFIVSVRDISDRKLAEATIQRSEQDLRTIFNHVYDAIFIHEMDGTIVDVNDRALELQGVSRERLLAANVVDLAAPDAVLEGLPTLFERAQTGESVLFEWKGQRLGDRSCFDAEVSLKMVTLGDRSILIASVRDISERARLEADRKQAEAQLQEKEQFLRSIYEGTENPIFVIDVLANHQFRISGWNLASEKISGLSSAMVLGKRPQDVFGAEVGNVTCANYERCVEAGKVIRYEEFLALPKGDFWTLTTLNPLKNAAGQVVRIVGNALNITDRKQAELEQQKLTALIETSSDFIGVASMDGQPLYVNAAALRLVGLDNLEAAKRLHISDFFCPEDLATVQQEILPTVINQGLWQGEFRFRHFKTGEPIAVDYTLFTITDPATQQPLGLATVTRDIRDRKRSEAQRAEAEQALRASESRYHSLAQIAPVGIFRTDLHGDCIYANERWHQFSGLSTAAILGQGWAEAIHPDDRAQVFASWYQAVQSNQPFQTECRFQHVTTGQTSWILAQATAERNPDGSIIGYVGTITDITDRKQAELEQQKLAAIVESSTDLIGLATLTGESLYINAAGQKLMGVDPSALIGKPVKDFVSPEGLNRFQQEALPVVMQQGYWQGEMIFRHLQTGEDITVDQTIFLIKEPQNGEPLCMATISRDIREAKRAAALLQHQAQQLEHANRQLSDYSQTLEQKVEERTTQLKMAQARIIAQEKLASLGTLTAGIAHEIRNPLNFVKNYAKSSIELVQDLLESLAPFTPQLEQQALELTQQLSQDLQENATAIEKQSDRIEKIIANMMQHARPERNNPTPQPIDLHALLDRSVKLAYNSKRILYPNFTMNIHTNYDTTLPLINLIDIDFSRAIINIVDNACDAMRSQQKQIAKTTSSPAYITTLELSTHHLGDQVEIRIRDNGCGIHPEVKDKIMDPFFTTKPPDEAGQPHKKVKG